MITSKVIPCQEVLQITATPPEHPSQYVSILSEGGDGAVLIAVTDVPALIKALQTVIKRPTADKGVYNDS